MVATLFAPSPMVMPPSSVPPAQVMLSLPPPVATSPWIDPAVIPTVSFPALPRTAIAIGDTAVIAPLLLKFVPAPLDRSTTGAVVLTELRLPLLTTDDAVPASSAGPPAA